MGVFLPGAPCRGALFLSSSFGWGCVVLVSGACSFPCWRTCTAGDVLARCGSPGFVVWAGGVFFLFGPGASWSWGSCLEVWLSASSCWASLPRLSSFSLIVGLVLLSADFLSVLVVCSSCVLLPHEKLGICVLLVFPCLCLPVVPVFGLLSMSCPFLSFLVLDLSGMSLLKHPLMFFQIFAFPVTW